MHPIHKYLLTGFLLLHVIGADSRSYWSKRLPRAALLARFLLLAREICSSLAQTLWLSFRIWKKSEQ